MKSGKPNHGGQASEQIPKKSLLVWSAFITSLVFLLFFRAFPVMTVHRATDDGMYMAHLESWLGTNPVPLAAGFASDVAIGAPLIWLPGGLLGKFIGMISGADASTTSKWVWACVGLYSFSLWGVTLYLMGRWIQFRRLTQGAWHGMALALILLLNVPVLFYAVDRTMMSHTAEIVLAIISIYLIDQGKLRWALIFGALLSVTRYNDLPIFLLIGGKAWDEHRFSRREVRPTINLTSVISVSLMIIVGLWIGYVAFWRGYGGFTLPEVAHRASFENLWHFVFGLDWGVLWFFPTWTLTLVIGLVRFPKLTYFARGAVLWMITECAIYSTWGGNGSEFGQRYLIGSFAGAMAIWIDLLASLRMGEQCSLMGIRSTPRIARRVSGYFTANAIWLTYFTAIYKTTPDTCELMNPELLLILLSQPFNPALYRILILQSPFGTLWCSWFRAGELAYREWAVNGPVLTTLAVATAIALVWTIYFLAVRPKRLLELPESIP